RESGIAYSFLRNNWYLENELGTIQAVMGGAPWITSAGAGRVGWAPRKDYADAAAAVLMGEGHENTVYELSGKPLSYDQLAAAVLMGEGPENTVYERSGKPLSYDQLAAEVAAVLGREIRVEHVDDETYARALKDAGVPEPLAAMFTGVQQAIRQGALDVESQDFEKVLGRPLTPIQDALRAILPG